MDVFWWKLLSNSSCHDKQVFGLFKRFTAQPQSCREKTSAPVNPAASVSSRVSVSAGRSRRQLQLLFSPYSTEMCRLCYIFVVSQTLLVLGAAGRRHAALRLMRVRPHWCFWARIPSRFQVLEGLEPAADVASLTEPGQKRCRDAGRSRTRNTQSEKHVLQLWAGSGQIWLDT